MFLNKLKSTSLVVALSTAMTLMGCSGSSTTSTTSSLEVSSLTSIPDFSQMVDNQSSGASINADVVGTPTPFSEISSDDIGEYFFGDTLDSDLSEFTTPEEQQQFQNDFFEGMNKCQMISTAARAFATIGEANTSLCYMKNVPVDGEFTIVTGSTDDPASVFDKGADSTVTKVTPTNMPGDEERPEQDIFIKVLGSNDTDNTYEVYLLQCSDGTANSMEHITVDAEGVMSYSTSRVYDNGDYSSLSNISVSAPLSEDEDGNPIIDPEGIKSLIVKDSFNGSWNDNTFEDTMNLTMAIDDSQIEILSMYKNIRDDSGYFLNKIYTVTNYTGSSFSDVAFSSTAMSQTMAQYDTDDSVIWEPGDSAYVIGAEFNEDETPKYVSETSSSLYTQASSATDNFETTMDSLIDEALNFDYSSLANPENDIEEQATDQDMSCDMEVTLSLTMDFSNEANVAISSICEAEVNRDGSYLCDAAWQKMNEMSSEFESREEE